MTMLRIFTSITTVLDVEESYKSGEGGMVSVFCVIYSLLIVVALRYVFYSTTRIFFYLKIDFFKTEEVFMDFNLYQINCRCYCQ